MTIDERLDNLMDFPRENMATKDDIAGINERLDRHEVRLDQLTIAINSLTKLAKDYWEEMTVLRYKVERMWKNGL